MNFDTNMIIEQLQARYRLKQYCYFVVYLIKGNRSEYVELPAIVNRAGNKQIFIGSTKNGLRKYKTLLLF